MNFHLYNYGFDSWHNINFINFTIICSLWIIPTIFVFSNYFYLLSFKLCVSTREPFISLNQNRNGRRRRRMRNVEIFFFLFVTCLNSTDFVPANVQLTWALESIHATANTRKHWWAAKCRAPPFQFFCFPKIAFFPFQMCVFLPKLNETWVTHNIFGFPSIFMWKKKKEKRKKEKTIFSVGCERKCKFTNIRVHHDCARRTKIKLRECWFKFIENQENYWSCAHIVLPSICAAAAAAAVFVVVAHSLHFSRK